MVNAGKDVCREYGGRDVNVRSLKTDKFSRVPNILVLADEWIFDGFFRLPRE